MQAFDTTEFKARLDKVRQSMCDDKVDALLVIKEGNISYLTGYEGYSAYVPQIALVTLDEDPHLVVREMDLRCSERACWLPADRQTGYPERYVGSAELNPWEAIGEFVRGKVGTSARIGAELSGTGVAATDYAKLLEALQVQELRDATGVVSRVKRVKSEPELAYMAEAAAITDQAMFEGIDKIAVGVRESEVAATIMHRLIAGTECTPGGALSITPWMHVGPIANAPHLKWSDGVYRPGLQTNLEFGAHRHRYAAPAARTAYLGTPPDRLHEVSKGVIEAWHAGFDTIRPGALCSDVARAVGAVLKGYGIEKESRCGYSVGLDWIDGGASLATNDDTELVPDMTFHLLIGIWNVNEGYNFSETVQVTDAGAKSFSRLPRMLFEIEA